MEGIIAVIKKVWGIAKGVIAWFCKNVALLVGIIEAIAKVIVGVLTLTPTKIDDPLIPLVDNVCSKIKEILYNASDWLMGKEF